MDFLISILSMLAVAIGVVALMVALFSASWQVLLIVLICGIAASKWLVHQHHLEKVIQDVEADLEPSLELEEDAVSGDGLQPGESSPDPILSYRGTSYQKPTAVEADATVAEGKYRGQNWQSSS